MFGMDDAHASHQGRIEPPKAARGHAMRVDIEILNGSDKRLDMIIAATRSHC